MKRHVYLPALLLTAALLVGCGHKAQPDADTDPNAQAALPPEGITALVMSDDTQVLRFRRDDDGVSAGEDVERCMNCDLLILDDLGTEFHKQFYQSTVYNIINTRMNRDLPTIISTNLNHNEISALYDERITSRIYTTYTCLHFVGQDVRVLKKSRMQNG